MKKILLILPVLLVFLLCSCNDSDVVRTDYIETTKEVEATNEETTEDKNDDVAPDEGKAWSEPERF